MLGSITKSESTVCRDPSKNFLNRELWDRLRGPSGSLKPKGALKGGDGAAVV